MQFDPILFGMTLGRIIETYSAVVRPWAGPAFHLAILLVIYHLARFGNRSRAWYSLYFLFNYAWLFIAIGVLVPIQLWRQAGPPYFAVYSATPFLILWILAEVVREWRHPKNDFDFRRVSAWRWGIGAAMMAWAFYYPNWRFDGAGFDWSISQLIYGYFGLMGCPVTLMALSLLFLRFPQTNPGLFRALTIYAVVLGGAQVLIGYYTDLPFFAMGLICLALLCADGLASRAKPRVQVPSAPGGRTD